MRSDKCSARDGLAISGHSLNYTAKAGSKSSLLPTLFGSLEFKFERRTAARNLLRDELA
jgi:hypothetical protein